MGAPDWLWKRWESCAVSTRRHASTEFDPSTVKQS